MRLIGPTLMTLTLLVLAAPGAVRAQTGDNPPRLVILDAVPDLDGQTQTLAINGLNFGESEPAVTLDGIPLALISNSDSLVIAMLPTSITTTPGSYLLTVSNGTGVTQSDAFSVTIGAVGPQGPQGEVGPVGPQGPPGVSGYEVVTVVDTAGIGSNSARLFEASCPAGKKVLGGGGFHTLLALDMFLNGPTSDTTWLVGIRNPNLESVPTTVTVRITCAFVN